MGPMELVDTHVHGDRISLEEWPDLLSRARLAGVVRAVGVGSDGKSGVKLLRLKQEHPDFMEVAFGYHPEQPVDWAQVKIVLRQIREHRDSLCGWGRWDFPGTPCLQRKGKRHRIRNISACWNAFCKQQWSWTCLFFFTLFMTGRRQSSACFRLIVCERRFSIG